MCLDIFLDGRDLSHLVLQDTAGCFVELTAEMCACLRFGQLWWTELVDAG